MKRLIQEKLAVKLTKTKCSNYLKTYKADMHVPFDLTGKNATSFPLLFWTQQI
jgi:hypothetical protein